MRHMFYRCVSMLLVFSMLLAWYVPGTVSAGDTTPLAENTTSELLFKEDFGLGRAYTFAASTWGSLTQGIAVSNATYPKAVLEGTNTVLHVNLPKTSNTASSDYNIDARFHTGSAWAENATFLNGYRGKSIVYQFKFKPVQTPTVNVLLRYLADTSDTSTRNQLSLFSIKANGEVQAFTKTINQTFKTGTWYDIALVCDFTDGSAEIYINGTKVEGSFTIPAYDKLKQDTAGLNPLLRFSDIGNITDTSEYYLDDIAVYTGTAPVDQFTEKVYYSENFAAEDYKTTKAEPGKGMDIVQGNTSYPGKVTYITDTTDGNHALNITTATAGNGWQIDARYSPDGTWSAFTDAKMQTDVRGKTLICQFMFKINTYANFRIAFRTENNGTKLMVPIIVKDNVLTAGSGETTVATLTAGQWYSIAVAMVFPKDGTSNIQSHVYLNNEYKGNYSVRMDQNDLAKANYMVRFYNWSRGTNKDDFLLDNIAVYEASKFIDVEYDKEDTGDGNNIGGGGNAGDSENEDDTGDASGTVGDKVYFKENFYYTGNKADYLIGNTDGKGIYAYTKNNTSAIVMPKTQDGNTALYIKASAADGRETYQINAIFAETDTYDGNTSFIDISGKIIVYQFKIKTITGAKFNLLLRTVNNGSTKATNLLSVATDGSIQVERTTLNETLTPGIWYDIAVVCNYATGKESVYIDGVMAKENLNIANFGTLGLTQANPMIRFVNSGDAADQEYLLDDIRVYDGDKPRTIEFDAEDIGSDDSSYVGNGGNAGGNGNASGTVGDKVYFKENFYYTGNKADYLIGNTDGKGIYAYTKNNTSAIVMPKTQDGNTALYIKASAADGRETYQINAIFAETDTYDGNTSFIDISGKIIVYQFKIKTITGAKFNLLLRTVNNGSTKATNLLSVATDGSIQVERTTLNETLTPGIWYDIAVVCNYATGKESVYIDGVMAKENLNIANFGTLGLTQANPMIRFVNSGDAADQEYLLDDIRVYDGDKPRIIKFDAEDTGSGRANGVAEVIEGTGIFETDFELSSPMSMGIYNNIIERIYEPGTNQKNQVLHMKRRLAHHFHADLRGLYSDSDAIVYEFDIYLNDVSTTKLTLQLKDTNSKYSTIGYIDKDGLKVGGIKMAVLQSKTWYKLAFVYDYVTRTRAVYLNGEKISGNNLLPIENDFGDSNMADTLRFWIGAVKEEEVENYISDLYIDNIRVYDGTKPYEGELLEREVVININYNTSTFTSVSKDWTDTMKGYISLHVRNGMMYNNGQKVKLTTAPIQIDGKYHVVLEEICGVLDITYKKVTSTSATVNGRSATITTKDGKHWIDAKYFFEKVMGKVVSVDDKALTGGLMIAGSTAFVFPDTYSNKNSIWTERADVQDLNDFLFFDRPSHSTILADYNASKLKGEHPRIQITSEDVKSIKEGIKTNDLMASWYRQLISAADNLVKTKTDPLIYELDTTGVRLLQVSREMLNHMYTLGMAYQLTGDQKYVDRAWVDLNAVCNFKDWHPIHDLDPAEMVTAVSIGYDWMYNALTVEQRQVIEAAVYKLAFYDAVKGYSTTGSLLSGAVKVTQNHNIVLNGSFTIAGLAFMDVYPEIASYLVSNAIHGADIMLTEFGPDGAWKEGPGYWEYAMQYTAKMLNALDIVFGTCYSLDKIEGLDKAANYILALQSDQGAHNYGDGAPDNFYVPEIFYLSNIYNDPSVTSTLLTLSKGFMKNTEDAVLALMWYDTSIGADGVEMEKDNVFKTEGVVTFRDKWTTGATAFVSIHGGLTRVPHAQADGGTFIYDWGGIRWAKELGSTPYDTAVSGEYNPDGRRWLLYRSRAEAHNTIVINPDNNSGHNIDSSAYLTRVESKNKGSIAVLNMTELYRDNASSAIRGFFFTDDRSSLVVRDEISLIKADSTVYWFMQTDATVKIIEDGKAALLTKNGKQVRLDFEITGTATAQLAVGPSTRALLDSMSPVDFKGDTQDPGTNRIHIKLSGAEGDVSITVKLSPVGIKTSPISDYNQAISTWSIPDGEIEGKPTVKSVTVGGREIRFDESNRGTYFCIAYVDRNFPNADPPITHTEIPEAIVTVDTSKYNVEVTNATMLPGFTTIVVSDKNDPANTTTYIVDMIEVPEVVQFRGMDSIQVVGIQVSGTPEPNNRGLNVIDNNVGTRWTDMGIGRWITLELEETTTVDQLMLMFYGGSEERLAYYSVLVSEDGVNFTYVFTDGKSLVQIGAPAEGEYIRIDLGGVTAKYVRLECNGNSLQGSDEGWNAVAEMVVTRKHVHTEGLEWKHTETQHWQAYTCCGTREGEMEDHSWSFGICTECGYSCTHADGSEDYCELCGIHKDIQKRQLTVILVVSVAAVLLIAGGVVMVIFIRKRNKQSNS